jgi:hypothetical protein
MRQITLLYSLADFIGYARSNLRHHSEYGPASLVTKLPHISKADVPFPEICAHTNYWGSTLNGPGRRYPIVLETLLLQPLLFSLFEANNFIVQPDKIDRIIFTRKLIKQWPWLI